MKQDEIRKKILEELYKKRAEAFVSPESLAARVEASEEILDREIRYLEGRGFLVITTKTLGKRYLNFLGLKITSLGIDFFENDYRPASDKSPYESPWLWGGVAFIIALVATNHSSPLWSVIFFAIGGIICFLIFGLRFPEIGSAKRRFFCIFVSIIILVLSWAELPPKVAPLISSLPSQVQTSTDVTPPTNNAPCDNNSGNCANDNSGPTTQIINQVARYTFENSTTTPAPSPDEKGIFFTYLKFGFTAGISPANICAIVTTDISPNLVKFIGDPNIMMPVGGLIATTKGDLFAYTQCFKNFEDPNNVVVFMMSDIAPVTIYAQLINDD